MLYQFDVKLSADATCLDIPTVKSGDISRANGNENTIDINNGIIIRRMRRL